MLRMWLVFYWKIFHRGQLREWEIENLQQKFPFALTSIRAVMVHRNLKGKGMNEIFCTHVVTTN